MKDDIIKVLFLCVGNSCRSQMAEGLLNHYGKGIYKAYSAGSKPENMVSPFAVKVMSQLGIDISNAVPKHVNVFNNDYFDYVITVCDNKSDSCPVFLGEAGISEYFPFPDPADFKGSEDEITTFYAKVRDDMKKMIIDYFNLTGDDYENNK